jgi:hypothetical protein
VNSAFTRPDVRESIKAWVGRQDIPKTDPIYLVAAAGGGIRAAFLTASYLAAADDLTQGRLASTCSRSAASPADRSAPRCTHWPAMARRSGRGPEAVKQPAEMGSRQRAMLCTLGGDFLSPAVATYLFPDLFRALWVPAFLYRDHTWQDLRPHARAGVVASVDPGACRDAQRPVPRLRRACRPRGSRRRRDVNLILNATRVQSGQRVVASTFTWPWLSTIDLFDSAYDTAATSMVGAVHNSARFTYVSPAGAYLYGDRSAANSPGKSRMAATSTTRVCSRCSRSSPRSRRTATRSSCRESRS